MFYQHHKSIENFALEYLELCNKFQILDIADFRKQELLKNKNFYLLEA
ncbi:hypothetical protein Ga0061079_10865 [Apibacter mensalis]|uniref:Uncharacterized protein n=1 Tax=Apibacter mensalis TaxID=1586267 RepID=A0A0X3AQC3_9FLAO|nr:hypothetical protein Ga0061079_10865 [Apibacter mensalis]